MSSPAISGLLSDPTSASSAAAAATGATTSPTATSSTSSTSAPSDGLGRDAFLNLLVTQLQNQDPLQPQDDSAFIAQLAQFSSLEQMSGARTDLDSILSMMQSLQTAASQLTGGASGSSSSSSSSSSPSSSSTSSTTGS